MIKFFRPIRKDLIEKNKTGKYLKYAIGEIILVVIGILIALSINNWNEENKNEIVEQNFYKEILNDLEKDKVKLEGLRVFYNNRIEHAGWLLEMVRNPNVPIDNIEFGKRIQPLYYGPLPVTYEASFDAAMSSGVFTNFKNKLFLKTLNQYYADFVELKGIMEATLRWLESNLEPVMSKIPDNYITAESGVYALSSELHDNKDYYEFIANIEDKRNQEVNLKSFLQKPEFEYYLTGDLGRSFNALASIDIRIKKLTKIKNEIEQYVSDESHSAER